MGEYEVTLTAEQVTLLSAIVEASNTVREEFFILRTMRGPFLRQSGLPGGHLDVYEPDFQALENLGFLTVTHYDSRRLGGTHSTSRTPRRSPQLRELKTRCIASSSRTRFAAATPARTTAGLPQPSCSGLRTRTVR